MGALLLREASGDCRQRRRKCYGAAIDASIVGRTTPNRRHADRKFLRPVNSPWPCDEGLKALLSFTAPEPFREGGGDAVRLG